jgi:hypothetical protein
MYRIILNSPPRTGSSFLMEAIRDMYYHNDRDAEDPRDAGEWSQDYNWIIGCHEPLLLLSDLSNLGVNQITCLRNPVDTVSSLVYKAYAGYGNSTIIGKPSIIQQYIDDVSNNKTDFLEEAMFQESKMWEGYTYNSIKYIDRLIPFTFEQVTKDTTTVLKNIYDIVGGTQSPRFRTTEEIENEIVFMQNHLAETKDYAYLSGSSNGLPVKKPKEYFEIVEMVKKFYLMGDLLKLYDEAKISYEKKQKEFLYSF